MGFRLPVITNGKQKLQGSSSRVTSTSAINIPKGYVAIYAGNNKGKRFVIPISYINHPEFQNLLSKSEEEFGFEYPMGALTTPCTQDIFIDLITCLNGSS